jgi:hypothetical protein
VDSAIRDDSKENGAIWEENAAVREAAFGNAAEAKKAAADGLKLYPTSQGVEVEAALWHMRWPEMRRTPNPWRRT